MRRIKIIWRISTALTSSGWWATIRRVAERLAQVKVPAEDYFIWLTGEGAVVKSLLARFEDESIDQQLVRSQAYWHSK
jgi:NADPH-dependent ferric siderophore reductase